MSLGMIKRHILMMHDTAIIWPELELMEDSGFHFRRLKGLSNKAYIFVNNQATLQTLSDSTKSHRTGQSVVLEIINLIEDIRELNTERRTPMKIEFH